MKRLLSLLVFVVMLFASSAMAQDAQPITVGRVYEVQGTLLRFVPEETDWVAVVRDAPFASGDTLYAGVNSRAELIVPNGTWIRLSESTQIQFMGLDHDSTDIDMPAGLSRFYNKDSDLVITVSSPFGYVLAYPGSVFDFYVGENSAEVVPVKGRVTFVHTATKGRYEISPGNPSVLADQTQVSSGDGLVDPDWDRWNRSRENFWDSMSRTTGPSAQYLPPPIRHEARLFDEQGRWERVYYDGGYRWFWRPTRVPSGWAPFTVGRWTEWYGDQTWIPYEPFGYVTHHYGNWIWVGGRWYWAPPVTRVTVGLPLLNIGFFWYPGRVAWVHSGSYIGWVPLAPRETYYSHYRWGGPYAVPITQVNLIQINILPRNYAYVRHAVVVPHRHLYTVNNYRPVRITNISNTTIINNYRVAPVIGNNVIKDYETRRERHNFANIQVKEKPHRAVLERIQVNQEIIRQGKRERPTVVQQNIRTLQEGKINREARIQQPKVTNFIVPANEVNLPKSQLRLEQRELRRSARPAVEEAGAPGKPTPKPERLQTKPEAKPEKPGRPAPKPEGGLTPDKPGRPSAKPQTVVPGKKDESPPKPEIEKPSVPSPPPKEDVGPAPKPNRKPQAISPVRPRPKLDETPSSQQSLGGNTREPATARGKPEKISPPSAPSRTGLEEQQKPVAKPSRVVPTKPQVSEKPPVKTTSPEAESDQPTQKPRKAPPPKIRPEDIQKGEFVGQERPR